MPFLFIAILALAQTQLGVVTGQIKNVDGTPAMGVRVALMSENNGRAEEILEHIAQTDAAGRYRLEGIEPGSYLITAGARVSPTYYPGVRAVAEARAVRVASGTMPTIDFQILPPATVRISGRIVGIPAGLPTNLFRAAMFNGVLPYSFTTVQPDGRFTFAMLPGTYLLWTDPVTETVRRIEIGNTDVTLPDFTFHESLWGRAVVEEGGDLPVMQASVGYFPEPWRLFNFSIVSTRGYGGRGQESRSGSAAVRQNGLFNIHVAPGEYTLTTLEIPIGYAVKSFTHGSVDLLKELPFQVSDKPTEIQITLTKNVPRYQKITGRTQEADGTPGKGWVELLTASPPQSHIPGRHIPLEVRRTGEVEIRPDGTFEFTNVPPGTYDIHVRVGEKLGPALVVTVSDADITGATLKTTR